MTFFFNCLLFVGNIYLKNINIFSYFLNLNFPNFDKNSRRRDYSGSSYEDDEPSVQRTITGASGQAKEGEKTGKQDNGKRQWDSESDGDEPKPGHVEVEVDDVDLGDD